MLFDSNILIYAGQSGNDRLRDRVMDGTGTASAITVVEVLGYHRLAPADLADLETMFASLQVIRISDAVIHRAVSLRQQRRMSLGDSIIAGTALEHDLELGTNNTADFAWIPGLRLSNPILQL